MRQITTTDLKKNNPKLNIKPRKKHIIPLKQQFFNCFKIPLKYIITYKNKNKEKWDIFIILMAIVNSFCVPLQLSFDLDAETMDWLGRFDIFIDCVFIIDIILMFFTSF
jgi:hypothetical protein